MLEAKWQEILDNVELSESGEWAVGVAVSNFMKSLFSLHESLLTVNNSSVSSNTVFATSQSVSSITSTKLPSTFPTLSSATFPQNINIYTNDSISLESNATTNFKNDTWSKLYLFCSWIVNNKLFGSAQVHFQKQILEIFSILKK